MSSGKHLDKEELERYQQFVLDENEQKFGIKVDSPEPNIRLNALITSLYQKTDKQVVVLIDEYDAPLLDVVHENTKLEELRNQMRNFYSPLKKCEPYLRFVFLTGITKFSQLSIFSELNNITNVSIDDEYAGICGITKDELVTEILATVPYCDNTDYEGHYQQMLFVIFTLLSAYMVDVEIRTLWSAYRESGHQL